MFFALNCFGGGGGGGLTVYLEALYTWRGLFSEFYSIQNKLPQISEPENLVSNL